jgi:hypothetical protein
MGKWTEQFSEEVHIASKYMKKYSTSLDIRKTQIKKGCRRVNVVEICTYV